MADVFELRADVFELRAGVFELRADTQVRPYMAAMFPWGAAAGRGGFHALVTAAT